MVSSAESEDCLRLTEYVSQKQASQAQLNWGWDPSASSTVPSASSPKKQSEAFLEGWADIRPTRGQKGTARPAIATPPRSAAKALLRNLTIERVNHVWAAEITYIPIGRGFLYLVVIIDWASRAVLAWRLSNTMDASFCLAALEEARPKFGKPEIFNTDQGSQFTSVAFTGALAEAGVAISMDGRGRWMDNVFIERLWRSLKYEEVYLKGYADGREAKADIAEWMDLQWPALASGSPLSDAEGGLARRDGGREGYGHDGQRCRVDHMPSATAADEAFGGAIRSDRAVGIPLTNQFTWSRCAGPVRRSAKGAQGGSHRDTRSGVSVQG